MTKSEAELRSKINSNHESIMITTKETIFRKLQKKKIIYFNVISVWYE